MLLNPRPGSGSSTLLHGSVAGGVSLIRSGTVDEQDREALFTHLRQALMKASQRHGSSRSAADGKQGHQRTPAMIGALLEDAKAALHSPILPEHLPAGGFTDVGPHTGGSPRDTAWPLVRDVFQVSTLSPPEPVRSLFPKPTVAGPQDVCSNLCRHGHALVVIPACVVALVREARHPSRSTSQSTILSQETRPSSMIGRVGGGWHLLESMKSRRAVLSEVGCHHPCVGHEDIDDV